LTYRRYHILPPWRRAAAFIALMLVAVGAAAAARADEPGRPLGAFGPARVADDVSVGGTLVGGMTAEQAETAIRASAKQPIAITLRSETVFVSPVRLGSVPLVRPAVERALAAGPGEAIGLRVLVDGVRLRAATSRFARRYSRPALDAEVRLRGTRPVATTERTGFAVRAHALARKLARELRTGGHGPLAVPYVDVRPQVTRPDVWPVIVIRRSANRLLLYASPHRKTARGVATGQPSYPTPLGSFTIVSKQLNPWWYPPDSDWARGLSPVPPGPGNPLGTRWMGLSVPGVGIHGTPDAASIGYSASHGCIRMKIPDAEWLFERVSVGTRVFIVP
jgi:lipoprotein-anchoring transpeptidase ErfK/SrfK